MVTTQYQTEECPPGATNHFQAHTDFASMKLVLLFGHHFDSQEVLLTINNNYGLINKIKHQKIT